MDHRYIVVEGPIGVGKTSLVNALAKQFSGRVVLEVVDRLCAAPGGKSYGILSVYLAVLSEPRAEFTVRRTCFTPSPDVDSAVVSVRFRAGVPDEQFRSLQSVVRAAFAQRRKTLRNAPVPFLSGGTAKWCELLGAAGIDPSSRAETVPPERYLRLAGLCSPESSGQ